MIHGAVDDVVPGGGGLHRVGQQHAVWPEALGPGRPQSELPQVLADGRHGLRRVQPDQMRGAFDRSVGRLEAERGHVLDLG